MSETGKGYDFLSLMSDVFNPEEAGDLEAVIEFEFTDLEETHHLTIKNKECELKKGPSEDFTAKIITTYDNWEKISNGEIDGVEAMLEGLYKIEGDFELVKRLDDLFPSDEGGGEENEKEEWGEDSVLVGMGAMTFSFIPWIFSWVFVESNYFLGILVPLLVSLGFACSKKFKDFELTYFEKANLFYFVILNIVSIFYLGFLQNFGIQINYISIALIWGLSILVKALTIDYSKYDYPPSITENKIYVRTNNIITLVWTCIFLFMGTGITILEIYELLIFSPALYVLVIGGLKFTDYFSEKYPEYIAKGRKKSILKPWSKNK